MAPPDFAVVDVETTGFAYKKLDRIVEVGIVRTDLSGRTQATYESLVNPGRDVGPTHIHGITAEMVREAPSFEDLAGDILEFLEGTCWVAHNATFDVNFLRSEFGRAGLTIQEVPHECTLRYTRAVFPALPSKKLERVCEALDIELDRHHAALSDAKATKKLFTILREERPGLVNDSRDPFYIRHSHSLARGASRPFSRQQFEKKQAESPSPMEDALNRLPSSVGSLLRRTPSIETDQEASQVYADLLDEVLQDRIVSEEELESLTNVAEEYGLSDAAAEEIHVEYLTNLIRYTLLDDVVTGTEREDIEKVQKLLGLQDRDLDSLIDEIRADLGSTYGESLSSVSEGLMGKSVCFTGSLQAKLDGQTITRKTAQQFADERGMVVKERVTKSLDYLVAADPHTQSGKAKKARRYEIPILAEMEFWRKLGVMVE